MAKLRVGVFGGSFDPPHIGHQMVVTAVLNSGAVDEIWLLPSGERSDKSYGVGDEDRLDLVNALLQNSLYPPGRARLCDIEIRACSVAKGTYELMQVLHEQNPDIEFYFVIGSDLIPQLPQWTNPELLRDNVKFLAILRADADVDPAPGYSISFVPQPCTCGVSSSMVRDLLQQGKLCVGYVSNSIAEIIRDRRLYVQTY